MARLTGAGVAKALLGKAVLPDDLPWVTGAIGLHAMNGMAELVTVAKYWKEWKDPRWIVLVLDNRDLNQVSWEQRVMGTWSRSSRVTPNTAR